MDFAAGGLRCGRWCCGGRGGDFQSERVALFAEIVEERTPLFERERLASELGELPEFLVRAERRMAGDIERAGGEVSGATEEHTGVLDIMWPFFQELDVFEVMRVAERAFIKFFEARARK